eukprot:10767182-Prorocentrum_lima.AAC.1
MTSSLVGSEMCIRDSHMEVIGVPGTLDLHRGCIGKGLARQPLQDNSSIQKPRRSLARPSPTEQAMQATRQGR